MRITAASFFSTMDPGRSLASSRPPSKDAGARTQAAAARVSERAAGWEPPSFGHVPEADAALFLCAVDHKTGYDASHEVDGRGPYSGSELMWELGLRRPERLNADALRSVRGEEVAEWFRVDGETVADPERRAALWRDLAAGLLRDHEGSVQALLDASQGRLGGPKGLVTRLAAYEAYADPFAKKAYLFAKIAERRGWLVVADPENWEVSADNVADAARPARGSGGVWPAPRGARGDARGAETTGRSRGPHAAGPR